MTRPSTPWQNLCLLLGILLVAMNLRPAVTTLAPLAERMRLDGLDRQLIGSLTTIPLVFFGLAGLYAGWIGERIGFARALGLGLLLLALGCGLRSMPAGDTHSWRLAGTVLVGAGIALGNVLLPGLVKSRYPDRVGALTSLYSTAINLGAAAGIALAVPLAVALPGGWNASLAAWGLFALVTLLCWSPQLRPKPARRPPSHPLAGVAALAKKGRAWQVALAMGLNSTVFYSSVAWLPTVLQYRGFTEPAAAAWVTAMQVMGCVSSLLVPVLAGRRRAQSAWITGCNLLCALSLIGILFLPLAWTGTAVIGLGLGINASFGLALLIIALRSRDAETAGNLSSMAQAFGYLLAAPGPWLVGRISGPDDHWEFAFGAVAAIAVAAAVIGWFAGREGEMGMER